MSYHEENYLILLLIKKINVKAGEIKSRGLYHAKAGTLPCSVQQSDTPAEEITRIAYAALPSE
jgi:hypothetical protein